MTEHVTIAGNTIAYDLIGDGPLVELAPFTRVQPFDLGGLIRVRRFRAGYTRLALVIARGRLANWLKYLDVAVPVKPADRDAPRRAPALPFLDTTLRSA